ncbi:MAG: hypothetical protein A3H32_08110 [Betaproteobacteria bacterium RIFCSPLOWO2_02_FULL_63_19]|nr:MAG: hypothetical protein A3H32_08110 [Betaproteobacteria bacterium RIFCSPLOWO2_02_FULL_63_19]
MAFKVKVLQSSEFAGSARTQAMGGLFARSARSAAETATDTAHFKFTSRAIASERIEPPARTPEPSGLPPFVELHGAEFADGAVRPSADARVD